MKFITFLLKQIDRDDPIGDVARDTRRIVKTTMDRHVFSSPNAILGLMKKRGACREALDALDLAVVEWENR